MDAPFINHEIVRQFFNRPLDWRFQQARFLLSSCRLPHRRQTDSEIRRAIRFLRAEDHCQSDRDRARLEKEWPALLAARGLALSEGPRRDEVQARILSGQTDEEIATCCAITAATVHSFEAFFFHVRDRLSARDWIAKQIGPGLYRGFNNDEIGKLWMALGYYGGAWALEVILAVTAKDAKKSGRRKPKFRPAVVRSAETLLAALMIPHDASQERMAGLHVQTQRLTRPVRLERLPARLADAAKCFLEKANVAPLPDPHAASKQRDALV